MHFKHLALDFLQLLFLYEPLSVHLYKVVQNTIQLKIHDSLVRINKEYQVSIVTCLQYLGLTINFAHLTTNYKLRSFSTNFESVEVPHYTRK